MSKEKTCYLNLHQKYLAIPKVDTKSVFKNFSKRYKNVHLTTLSHQKLEYLMIISRSLVIQI